MIISLKDLKEQCDAKNLNWLNTTNVKNRIKNVIKSNKLPIEVTEFLWNQRELRWDLIRYQTLSKDLQWFVLNNYKNPREISRPCYKEMLTRQDLEDDIINYIDNSNAQDYLDAWKYIPEKMKRVVGTQKIFSYLEFEKSYYNKAYIETIVTICKERMFLREVLDLVIDNNYSNAFNSNASFLEMLGSSIYFDDVSMDKMNKILEPETFKVWAKLVVSRNNCSTASKALLLLFN